MSKSWLIQIEETQDESGDGILTFPLDLLDEIGWKEGDELIWNIRENGTVSLSKKNNG
jgi:bifunctional DNA-binding transcriptional regulator/antitoxin component of YhaV-PrlF toxin-antitoxin module